VLLSAPVITSNVSYTSITVGSASVPWEQDLSQGASITGDKQIVSVAKGSGVTEVLACVQDVNAYNYFNNGVGFGHTSLRLYSKTDGSSTWYEQDLNTAFDGLADMWQPPTLSFSRNYARQDDSMAMDADGNLYIEMEGQISTLAVDRIPAAMVQELATDPSEITPYDSTQVLSPEDIAVTGYGALRPQMAVGSITNGPNAGETAIYLFSGDISGQSNFQPLLWYWVGNDSDSLADPNSSGSGWTQVNDPLSIDVCGEWAPMTVDGNGTLFSTNGAGSEVYEISPSSPVFTPIFATPAQFGQLVAQTDSQGDTTLYTLCRTLQGSLAVEDTPAAGNSAGTWSDLNGSIGTFVDGPKGGNPAFDPTNGQPSVLFTNELGDIFLATLSGGIWYFAAVSGPLPSPAPTLPGAGLDTARTLDFTVGDGSAAVVWVQNDPGGEGNDVAEVQVDLTQQTNGESLEVADTPDQSQNTISLSGSTQPGGTLTVGVDGQSYSFVLTGPLVSAEVDGSGAALLTVNPEGGAFSPLTGVNFENAAGDPGALALSANGNMILTDDNLEYSNCLITFSNVNAYQLNLDGGTLGVERDMSQGPASTLDITGATSVNQLYLDNTGDSATLTPIHDQVVYGNLTVAYSSTLVSLAIGGENTFSGELNLSSAPVPQGNSSTDGFVDPGYSDWSIASSDFSNNAELPDVGSTTQWVINGYYLGLVIEDLDFRNGSDSSVLIGASPTDATIGELALTAEYFVLEVDLGGGDNSVTFNGSLYSTTHSPVIKVVSSTGDDTVTVVSPPAETPVTGSVSIRSKTLTYIGGSSGNDLLMLDYSNGYSSHFYADASFQPGTAPSEIELAGPTTSTGEVTLTGTGNNRALLIESGDTTIDTLNYASGSNIEFLSGHFVEAANDLPAIDLVVAAAASVEFTGAQSLASLDVGGTVTVDSGVQITVMGELTIDSGGQLTLSPSPDIGEITDSFGTILIDGGGSMDIGNATLIVQSVPDEYVVAGYLANGFADNYWDGTTTSESTTGGSITSVTAYNDDSGDTTIGYGEHGDFDGSDSPYATGGADALTGDQMVIKLAVQGDLLLTGSVGCEDLHLLLAAYGTTTNESGDLNTWANGNIDYNSDGTPGLVGPNDLALLLAGYGLEMTPTGPAPY